MTISVKNLAEKLKIVPNASGSCRVKTPEFVATYAFVFEPRETPNGEMKYQMCMLFDRTKMSELKPVVQAIANAMAKKFGNNMSKWPKMAKCPVRDGDEERDGNEYKGMLFINCGTKNAPGIIDTNRQPMLTNEEFYSGCHARATLTFYGYDTSGNKGVGCGLNNILKISDGKRLDGQVAAEDDFAEDTEATVSDDSDAF